MRADETRGSKVGGVCVKAWPSVAELEFYRRRRLQRKQRISPRRPAAALSTPSKHVKSNNGALIA